MSMENLNKLVDALKNTKYTKMCGEIFDRETKCACSIGVYLLDVKKFSEDEVESLTGSGKGYETILKDGIHPGKIWKLNDDRHLNLSFKEIAKKIEDNPEEFLL